MGGIADRGLSRRLGYTTATNRDRSTVESQEEAWLFESILNTDERKGRLSTASHLNCRLNFCRQTFNEDFTILRLILFLTILSIAGCGKPQPTDPPGYSITIPNDIPEHLELMDKDGTKHEANGRELYASGHKYGWQCCWEAFGRGVVTAQDQEAWERYIPQDYIIAVKGFEAGFKQCQATLSR